MKKLMIAAVVLGMIVGAGIVTLVWAVESRLTSYGSAADGVYGAQLIDDGTVTGAREGLYIPKGVHRHSILCDIQTGTISVRPEFSNDSQTTWIAGNAITADGLYTFDADFDAIRMNITAISGGTVDCWWRAGMD